MRYLQVLDIQNRKTVWTQEEEEVFILAHQIYGNRWTQIAECIPGRSDAYLKNHFYSTMRTLMPRVKSQAELTKDIKAVSVRSTAYFLKYMRDAINFIETHK